MTLPNTFPDSNSVGLKINIIEAYGHSNLKVEFRLPGGGETSISILPAYRNSQVERNATIFCE